MTPNKNPKMGGGSILNEIFRRREQVAHCRLVHCGRLPDFGVVQRYCAKSAQDRASNARRKFWAIISRGGLIGQRRMRQKSAIAENFVGFLNADLRNELKEGLRRESKNQEYGSFFASPSRKPQKSSENGDYQVAARENSVSSDQTRFRTARHGLTPLRTLLPLADRSVRFRGMKTCRCSCHKIIRAPSNITDLKVETQTPEIEPSALAVTCHPTHSQSQLNAGPYERCRTSTC